MPMGGACGLEDVAGGCLRAGTEVAFRIGTPWVPRQNPEDLAAKEATSSRNR